MTDFDFLAGIGWRDLVLVLAAGIGVYLVLSVLRLFRVSGKRGSAAPLHVAPPQVAPSISPWPPRETPPPPAEPTTSEPDFFRELARTNVEAELDRLRRECARMREEMVGMAEEITRLKLNRSVSPHYNEATALAQQGMPPAGIAGQCGISIGEAELVAALARGGSEFEQHEQGEDRDERNTYSGNRTHG